MINLTQNASLLCQIFQGLCFSLTFRKRVIWCFKYCLNILNHPVCMFRLSSSPCLLISSFPRPHTLSKKVWVVRGHRVFGRVSGGSDFPAGQMAELCGQSVYVCVCVLQPAGGRIAHTLALSSVPLQLCFSLILELLMCSICGPGLGASWAHVSWPRLCGDGHCGHTDSSVCLLLS